MSNNLVSRYPDRILKEEIKKGIVDKVFVTGCLSERYKPDLQKEIPNVDQYFGTTERPGLLKALGADYKHELIGERLTTTPQNYAYLKIAEGCAKRCAFCIIPKIKGPLRSKPVEQVIKEFKALLSQGVKEVILHLGSLEHGVPSTEPFILCEGEGDE